MSHLVKMGVLIVGAVAVHAHAGVIYSDGVFDPNDWSTTELTDGSGGTAVTTQVLTGGNPDEYIHVVNTVTGDGSTSAAIFGFHIYTAGTYDASDAGAIGSIDFSIDAMYVTPLPAGQGQAFGLAAVQDGVFYRGPSLLTFGDTTWQTQMQDGLVVSNFFAHAGGPAIDFSEDGAPIQFGFFTANSTPSGNPYFREAGYDNWTVEITIVPAPSAAVLLLLSVVGRRRR